MLIVLLVFLAFAGGPIILGLHTALYGTAEDIARLERGAAKEMEVIYKHHPHLKK